MYVCMYVYMCFFPEAVHNIYACTFVCLCVYVCVCGVCASASARARACVCVCMRACVRVCVRSCVPSSCTYVICVRATVLICIGCMYTHTTIQAMAAALGWTDRVSPAIMCGTLGYAVGTLLGMAVGFMCKNFL